MGFKTRWEPEDKDLVIAEVCGRLAKGEMMSSICSSADMPDPSTVLEWAQQAPETHGLAIARARSAGFDAIAQDSLLIAEGAIPVGKGPGDVQRDKLRVDTRLKLLAKWDPKRYGDAFQLKHADADGEKLETGPLISELMGLLRGKSETPEG